MFFRTLAFLLPLSFAVMAAGAQADEEETPQAPEHLVKLDNEVVDLTQQLGDWSEQYEIISDAINSMWEQNGWSSDADQFAKSAALRISRIPPWKFQDRVQELRKTVKDRYKLNEAQANQFHKMMYKEMWNMTLKYGPVFFKQAKEGLNTRLRNEPFTSEQVARWVEESEPFVDEYLKDLERLQDEFGSILTDEQRKIYQHDLESMNKRLKHFTQSLQSWKKGNWQPADWGLQNDPIHLRAEAEKKTAPPTPVLPVASAATAYDESTWAQYVIAFIKRYQLDEAQQKACNNILDDLVTRARHYRQAHQRELEKLSSTERSEHHLLAPIRQMFEELKFRLNTIPTEIQHQKVARPPVTQKADQPG